MKRPFGARLRATAYGYPARTCPCSQGCRERQSRAGPCWRVPSPLVRVSQRGLWERTSGREEPGTVPEPRAFPALLEGPLSPPWERDRERGIELRESIKPCGLRSLPPLPNPSPTRGEGLLRHPPCGTARSCPLSLAPCPLLLAPCPSPQGTTDSSANWSS